MDPFIVELLIFTGIQTIEVTLLNEINLMQKYTKYHIKPLIIPIKVVCDLRVLVINASVLLDNKGNM